MENPLQGYYRNKEIFVKLPTGGKWMQNPPQLTADGEIGVKPMTVKDELILTVPDALYNGEAMFDLVQSICPDIHDVADISLPDVDVILLASRASSYDKKFPVDAKCPHCESGQMFDIDLQVVLSHIQSVTDSIELQLDDLLIEMRPNTLSAVNANRIKTSETARIMLDIKRQEELADENLREKYGEQLAQIAAANFVLIADAIVKVTMPDGTIVSERQHLVDWLANSNRSTVEMISKHQLKMNLNGLPKEYTFSCGEENCGKEFKTEVEFNPSFFFTTNSNGQSQLKK